MTGMLEFRRNKSMVSRGLIKLMDILRQGNLKMYGKVLKLCCGAAGWKQELAGRPEVIVIKSVTFGDQITNKGYENFTILPFRHRENETLRNGDARNKEPGDHQWILSIEVSPIQIAISRQRVSQNY